MRCESYKTNKQNSKSHFSMLMKNPLSSKQQSEFQTIQKWGNGFAISFLWLKQRIEAGKRESQKVCSLSPSHWLPSAAFSTRNARDDVVQSVCTEALANPLYLMRLGNQSGPGQFLWCISAVLQSRTAEKREMLHSFCKYLGQDFLKVASRVPNILSTPGAPAEDPIASRIIFVLLRVLHSGTLLLQHHASIQVKRRGCGAELSWRMIVQKGDIRGVWILFWFTFNSLFMSVLDLTFLTPLFFTVWTPTFSPWLPKSFYLEINGLGALCLAFAKLWSGLS